MLQEATTSSNIEGSPGDGPLLDPRLEADTNGPLNTTEVGETAPIWAGSLELTPRKAELARFIIGCILVFCFLVFNKTLSGRNYMNVKLN